MFEQYDLLEAYIKYILSETEWLCLPSKSCKLCTTASVYLLWKESQQIPNSQWEYTKGLISLSLHFRINQKLNVNLWERGRVAVSFVEIVISGWFWVELSNGRVRTDQNSHWEPSSRGSSRLCPGSSPAPQRGALPWCSAGFAHFGATRP